MSNAHTDFVRILTEIKNTLTNVGDECALEPQPCRAGVYPAGEVPLDACGESCDGAEGMLWVNMQATANPRPGDSPSCIRIVLTGQVGVARCAAAPTRSGAPSVGAIEANAVQQGLDADKLLNAIVCCANLTDNDRMRLQVGAWTPIDNQGGCYGGFWTVSAVYDICC